MKPVAYHRLAENELIASAVFYEAQRVTLGENFLDAVGQTLAGIQTHPQLGNLGKFGTRSRKVNRFPFRLVYLEQGTRIWMVAVAHLSRKPNYWLERID